MRVLHNSTGVLLSLAMAGLIGCNKNDGKVEVTGKVTLTGSPMREGVLELDPLEGQGTKSGALIKNGEYKIPGDKGLQPGRYRVRITSGDGVTNVVKEEDVAGPSSTNIVSKDLVPADWSQEVTVTKQGPNKFNFDIP
jgi:hypothetical protein